MASTAGETQGFGPGSLIPSPFDPRLILRIAPAVAKAAMDSGVATRPIKNFDEYRAMLERFAFRSGLVMKPMFAKAQDPAGARDLCRRRGRARAARDPGRAGGKGGAADPGRAAVGGRSAHQALRPVDQGRPRFRPRQSRGRSALPLLRAVLHRACRPPWRDAGCGAHGGAHQQHRDRGAGGGARRGRRHALRRRGPLHAAICAMSARSSASCRASATTRRWR